MVKPENMARVENTNGNVAVVRFENKTDSEKLNVKSLLVLTGFYNKYGRKMSIEKLTEFQKRFSDLIDDVGKNIE